MNVLLIGSGGREHAMSWKIAASPLLTKLYAAPGNPGIAEDAEIVPLKVEDHAAVIAFCRQKKIDLVVVGPETPLTAGLADDLLAARIKVFGPQKIPATLEGSKSFTKRLCAEHDIPTAAFIETQSREEARAYIEKHGAPIVLKADGLHAGKGVIVAMDKNEALMAVDQVFAMGGNAPIVIEEFLEGEEASYFCFVHGEQVLPLASAQDHKRVFDNDQGPNTGGMGAYSPAPVFTKEVEKVVLEKIVHPTARALAKAGTPYSGVLYIGLMITKDGPKLIEYNVRFGDPECQVLMPRMKDDLLTLMLATANGELDKSSVRWRDEVAITVVFANKGYPGAYRSGAEIRGIEKADQIEGVTVFHAGTKTDGEKLIANGGRVLNVTAIGKTVTEARERAYKAISLIDWPEGFYRSDIGWRAIAREREVKDFPRMKDLADLFPGFESHWIDTSAGKLFARSGGNGPPLLLIHGFPQTHVEYHRIAPALAAKFKLILPDLPGYGWSDAPKSDGSHSPYTKRAMAAALIEVMQKLGHVQFGVIGHDRGGRVGYRMALDHPGRVSKLSVLDIIPTLDMWTGMDARRAMVVYHWPFLAQREPLPEMLISKAPIEYLEWTLGSWSPDGLKKFDPRAMDHYRAFFADPARIHACCEDYRAGQSTDVKFDEEDFKAGKKITCPTLALWGTRGIPNSGGDPLAIWKQWGTKIEGRAIECGHFLPEENPWETEAALLEFFTRA